MNLKYIFFIFFGKLISFNNDMESLSKNQCMNIIDKTKENEAIIDAGANRILQILDAFDLFEKYHTIQEIKDSFMLLLEKFFGLRVNYNNLFEKELFIQNIILSVGKFNNEASLDLKYLCDMQIKYILSFKLVILSKIKKNLVYELILLSYYNYLLYPVDYINISNHVEKNHDIEIEKEIDWQEASLQLLLEFGELGILNDRYLYELYDNLFIKKLSLNKEYTDILLIKKMLPDAIGEEDDALELLVNKYNTNINFFKKQNEYIEFYEDKKEFFLVWLLDKRNIVSSIEKFINDDTLFFLFTSVLLYKSILKMTDRNYYPLLNDELLEVLKKFANKAEFILYKFFAVFDKKLQINWNNLPIIVISENRLHQIITYIKAISVE
jgi:hypothetical protein